MSIRDLERVLYESYVIIDPGTSGLKKKQLISEDEYYELTQDETVTLTAKMGQAIRDLLKIDLDELRPSFRAIAKIENSVSGRRRR
jgi:DNA-directed RNA polymerase subunit beta'